MGENPGPAIAIAGGASGGDLLFLEVCEELGIERRMYLVIPRDEYVKASVAPSGPNWVKRFNHQQETAACRTYQQSEALPVWLQDRKDYGVWQRSNAWMLHNALVLGGTNTTLDCALGRQRRRRARWYAAHGRVCRRTWRAHDYPGYQQAVRSLALGFACQGPRAAIVLPAQPFDRGHSDAVLRRWRGPLRRSRR